MRKLIGKYYVVYVVFLVVFFIFALAITIPAVPYLLATEGTYELKRLYNEVLDFKRYFRYLYWEKNFKA